MVSLGTIVVEPPRFGVGDGDGVHRAWIDTVSRSSWTRCWSPKLLVSVVQLELIFKQIEATKHLEIILRFTAIAHLLLVGLTAEKVVQNVACHLTLVHPSLARWVVPKVRCRCGLWVGALNRTVWWDVSVAIICSRVLGHWRNRRASRMDG